MLKEITEAFSATSETVTVQPEPLVDAGLCVNCKIRPGTETWVGEGGTLALVHGFSARWCLQCCLEAQIEYCTKAAERLPDLKRQLEEACR